MTSSIHEIFDDIDGSLLGRKNTLVYFQKAVNQKGFGVKTNWIMHEYVLDERLVPSNENEKEYDVVICRIRQREEKKGKTKTERDESEVSGNRSYRQSVPIDHDWRAWIKEV
ncbi:unnamed protein product [Fraxinus pennsylvanica]|uniref:NAC domain-containing protein n=1 Tax=Fraxinus pennsylvanica TaxID=56036 RepID=A0AAD2AKF0_9LAMI|nr:unnamed protein product [Fraxinus pennsylvanica]